MIASYINEGLKELNENGKSAKIDAKLQRKIIRILDALRQPKRPEDMNIPGFDFHALNWHSPTRYTVHVNGPWCITFEFEGENARRVDFEQYH
jgi:toxin HigB-1